MKKESYRVQIGSVTFYKFLKSIGFTQAKSLTISEIKVPDKYFFHFVRGCFDGDGCSYSYWDPRWKSSFMFYIAFASGSIKFVTWLRATIARLGFINGHVTLARNKNIIYQLKYSKYEAIKLAGLLYKKEKGMRLSRKYLKIKASLDIVREQGKYLP